MSESDEIRININVAERNYRLTIDKADEEKVRRAAELINERVKEYKSVYTDKDYLSLVSMACIQFATTVVKYEKDSAFKDQYLDKQLDVIDELLTENL
ncbi:MAG: cell division protein ZapA [Bacteroidales bacterium]|nr:cell division protein ZapA [Bacteroidales bacterium]